MASLRSLAATAAFFGNMASVMAAPKDKPLPALAQVIDQKSFNVLPTVPTAEEYNASSAPWVPVNLTAAGLLEKPFHVYDDEFLDIIGPNPTFSQIGETPKDPIFHEAVVWYKPKDEMWFVQNAGAPDAGTGVNKSAVIYKISLKEADAVKNERNAVGKVKIQLVEHSPPIPNPNGAVQYKGKLLFAASGQGAKIPPALVILDPSTEPAKTTTILNNFHGRQFNSLNDVAINPRNGEIYFTDPSYGLSNNFRPAVGIRRQVWRFDEKTGAVSVAADDFIMPNGITFSQGGKYAYVTDTGIWRNGLELENPSSIYRFDVQKDGTFENRKTFAFTDINIPDGVHVDSKGNVYAGCGDGVQVWNPSGKLIGKIYTGRTAANFQFASNGRLTIMGETKLYYVTVAAQGEFIESNL